MEQICKFRVSQVEILHFWQDKLLIFTPQKLLHSAFEQSHFYPSRDLELKLAMAYGQPDRLIVANKKLLTSQIWE